MSQRSKIIGETVTLRFEFYNQVPWGVTLSDPVVSVSVISGEDIAPEDMLTGVAVFNTDTRAHQRVHEGTAGVIYSFICAADGSDGNSYECQIILAVLPNDASFGPPTGLAINGDVDDHVCIGNTVSYVFPITGGYAPYGPVTISSGAMPQHWTVFVSGSNVHISGLTDDVAGTYNFTVRLVDFVGNVATSPQSTIIEECGAFLTLGASAAHVYLGSADAQTWTDHTDGTMAGVTFGFCTATTGTHAAASYTTGGSVTFYYSTDDFQTVAHSASGPFTGSCKAMFNLGTTMVAILENAPMLYTAFSTNGGVTWTQGHDITNTGFFNSGCAGSGKYACAFSDGIYVTSDLTAAWTKTLAGNWTSIGFNGTGFLIGENTGATYEYSTDATAWTVKSGTTPVPAYSIVGQSGYFIITCVDSIGSNGGPYKTTDNGNTITAKYLTSLRLYVMAIGTDAIVAGPGGGGGGSTITSNDDGETWNVSLGAGINEVGLCYMPD